MSDTPFSVRGKRVVVVGAARSGVAAAELLVRRGASVTLTDVREQIEDEERLRAAGVALELGGHHASTFSAADLVVLSPGVPSQLPAVEAARRAGVPVTGELELASRWLRGRIVAITGTKGKSTTTTLTGRMLEAAEETLKPRTGAAGAAEALKGALDLSGGIAGVYSTSARNGKSTGVYLITVTNQKKEELKSKYINKFTGNWHRACIIKRDWH
jgi:UDP-N-acetylmuramate-alanine ligase